MVRIATERRTALIETMTVVIIAAVLLAVALTSHTDSGVRGQTQPGDNFLKAGQAVQGLDASAGGRCLRGNSAVAGQSPAGCATGPQGAPCPELAIAGGAGGVSAAWKEAQPKKMCVGAAGLCGSADSSLDRCASVAPGRWV